ncbi:MAG: hypothetical protein IT258_19205 [Saprospiraceae bacterium]|nr:hypothetical protein [Saprospiraceae bacterium]
MYLTHFGAMNNKILVFFLFLLVGCGTKENPNEIQLFNGYALSLKAGESVAEIDETISKRYAEAQKNSNFQVPLFRYISHKDYDMFVGVPYNTSLEEIAAAYQQQANAEGTSVECNGAQCCLIEKNSGYHCKCAFKNADNSLVFIMLESKAATLPDNLMKTSALAARLVKH